MSIALAAFVLSSATFKAGAPMPLSTVYTQCGGTNRSPDLRWNGAPRRTRSFALIVHDPDAPHPGGWYHWVLYDLPSSAQAIGASFDLPRRGQSSPGRGTNDFRDTAYDGPCPPPGKVHHYRFMLYALDVAHISGDHLSGPQLQQAMRGHILAQTLLVGTYRR